MNAETTIKHIHLIVLAILVLAGSAIGAAYADKEVDELLDGPQGVIDPEGSVEEWQFHEDAIDLPAYPDFDKLKPLQIDASQGRLKYFIDPVSIRIGRNDVVMATIVITSDRGASNVLFDGYRCDTREYKSFAYGTSKKTFYELEGSKWQQVYRSTGTSQDFRRELVSVYFCDVTHLALSKKEILRLIDYPGDRDDDGRMF